MDGVKTAIIGFLFVCIIFPSLIKNRGQYYMALAAVVLSMLFKMLAYMFDANRGFVMTAHALEVLLEVVSILILILAAGGLSARDLAGDMGRAIEVMRRGEETTEVIIPHPSRPRAKDDQDPPQQRIVLDDDDNDPLYDPKRFNPGVTPATSGASPPPNPAGSPGPIPLEDPKPRE